MALLAFGLALPVKQLSLYCQVSHETAGGMAAILRGPTASRLTRLVVLGLTTTDAAGQTSLPRADYIIEALADSGGSSTAAHMPARL